MAKNQGVVQSTIRRRAPVPAVAAASSGAPAPLKKPFNPAQFLREVRAEGRKVTWTSWKETWITSIMVGIMVVMTAVFFFGVDWILQIGEHALLSLANAE